MKAVIFDPVETVLDVASSFSAVREEPGRPNRGPAIDAFNYLTIPDGRAYPMGMRAAPWCASFVSTVGRLALGAAWPVEVTPSVQKMVDWAIASSVWHGGGSAPEVGDLFALYYPHLSRHGHVGFVRSVDGARFRTVEGNTSPGASREGFGVFELERETGEHVGFVRWHALSLHVAAPDRSVV